MDERIKKKIWIDLDNSPHVLFFKPIIDELQKQNFPVVITVRDCFQVIGLADMYQLKYKKIGVHFGKNKLLKVFGLIVRAIQLLPFVLHEKPKLALSHGSRSQALLANVLGMDSIIAYDYEFTKSLFCTKPKWYMAPELISDTSNKHNKLLSYPGIKEDVYVPFFKPDNSLRSFLGIKEHEILVSIRPPATEAHYHNPESEPLFETIINKFGHNELVRMIVLPRGNSQKELIKDKWSDLIRKEKLIIPEKVIDGLNLIWASDLVISGGGTMNREASALHVPVYSIFRGKIGAVDRFLVQDGRLTLIENLEDIKKITLIRRSQYASLSPTTQTLDTIVNHIISIIEPESVTNAEIETVTS
jgi:predicted glycosyltransferase